MPDQRTLFAYPRLSKADFVAIRIGGNGLGNLLFTWARALGTARREGWQLIWPTWRSYKPKNKRVNPYDLRVYADLFRPTADYVTGARRYGLVYRRGGILPEHEWLESGTVPPGKRVIEFRGMAGFFEPFLNDQALVRQELLNIAQPQHLAGFNKNQEAFVGVHIRRGDFEVRSSLEAISQTPNCQQPASWYIAAMRAIRRALGDDTRFQVFSDGTEAELRSVLEEPNTQRVEYGSSLADMLALSRSRILIASGSTFSMWASYLGQMPVMWFPAKKTMSLNINNPEWEFEWAENDPLPAWLGSGPAF